MARDTTVQFRIDSTVKEEAFAVFKQMGISPSEAVRVFLKQVQQTRSLPFAVVATDATDANLDDDYTDWLRQRLASTIKQLDSGAMKSYPTDKAKALVRDRLAVRRSALAAGSA